MGNFFFCSHPTLNWYQFNVNINAIDYAVEHARGWKLSCCWLLVVAAIVVGVCTFLSLSLFLSFALINQHSSNCNDMCLWLCARVYNVHSDDNCINRHCRRRRETRYDSCTQSGLFFFSFFLFFHIIYGTLISDDVCFRWCGAASIKLECCRIT